MRDHLLLLFVILITFSEAAFTAAKPAKFSLSTGATFTSGDYGSHETTEMLYVPLTGKYSKGKWSFKLTVPYLRKKGPKNVVRDIGQVGGKTIVTKRVVDAGLGDLLLSARYRLLYLPRLKTLFDLTGKIKLATADEDKGLGTGENDYSVKVGVYKLAGNFTPYASLGYRFYGSSSQIQLRDVFFGSAGLSYKLSNQSSVGIDLYLKEKTSSTSISSRQLTSFVSQKLDKNWKLQGYLLKGLSENTPDWGGGFAVTYLFD